jgi:hypothetical protein
VCPHLCVHGEHCRDECRRHEAEAVGAHVREASKPH